jgi:Ala-tRNA(Pro) deacylase
MPLSERLRSFLDAHHAEYTVTTHHKAFTAREVAFAEHLPPREVAKTVIIFGDGEYHMLAVPASRLVDFQELRTALGLAQARLATEDEILKLFPDCELGAMPPIGSPYGLALYVDTSLAAEPSICFNAGTHRDVIHMSTAEFRRIAAPTIVPLVREMAAHSGW